MRRAVASPDSGARTLPLRVLPAALRGRVGMPQLRGAFDDRAAVPRAGADSITIHVEATPHAHYTLSAIHEAGCAAGAAITPGTPAASLDEIAHELLDLALCMSVNPGWGGQEFIPWSLDKLARMRRALPDHVALEVDGGVHERTARSCVEAGATLLVTGSAVCGASDPGAAYAAIA